MQQINISYDKKKSRHPHLKVWMPALSLFAKFMYLSGSLQRKWDFLPLGPVPEFFLAQNGENRIVRHFSC